MAQFHVYRLANGALVIDCQSDLVDGFATRLTVPLVPPGNINRPLPRLLPLFSIEGVEYVMATPFAAAIPARELGHSIADLSAESYTVTGALDMLLSGF
jgi:toxin CcdB